MTTMTTQDRPPWVQKSFLKEKLKVQERYWRPKAPAQQEEGKIVVVPDGIVWRRYLKLLLHCIQKTETDLQWILLESAAELMDWRNASLSLDNARPESAALQERNKIRQLLQDYPSRIEPFCDLSIREEEFDEYQLLNYVDMSVTDRSRHALFRAGRMLGAPKVILLVHDENDLSQEEMRVVTMDDFLSYLEESYLQLDMEELWTLKQVCEETYERRNTPPDATDDSQDGLYLTEAQVEHGLRDGTLLRGRLEVTKANTKEAYVTAGSIRYFCNQFDHALHHDVVAIQPLPEGQWGRPVGRRRLVHHNSQEDDEEGIVSEDAGPAVPTARVVSVVTPSRRQYVATMVDQPVGDERAVLVVPMDIRIPKIRIQTRAWRSFINQRLLVEVDSWERSSSYPNGHCIKTIGPIGDMETEITCLLRENEIQLEPFSAMALASLPAEGAKWTIPEVELHQRRDLRKSHRIFSVDPPGCQDIDDTMHARVLANGDIEVGVHIADVTYFVPHNSALDREAQVRGTTFYLVDRRFDMLPSLLSSDLCSLHGNTDRLAVSVIWTMSPDLSVVKSCWYGRTVIHNCQAMTYQQAHNILHDEPPDDPSKPPPPPLTAGAPVDPSLIKPLKHDLGILQRLTRKLRKDREDIGGAVDLSSGDLGTELKFALDEEGNPVKVEPKKQMEIHHTIAEMMILANQSVATKIFSSFPDSSLLRIHQTVSEDRFGELESALKAGGIAFDGSSNMALAESLKKARQDGKRNAIVNSLWQSLATRAMSEALYVCTGLQDKGVGLSHYGLGIDKYTHFTSPIRRYADVVVHKQLLAALSNDNTEPVAAPLPEPKARSSLEVLPDSSAISILKGEGLKDVPSNTQDVSEELNDDFLDSLIEGASNLALGDPGDGAESAVSNIQSEDEQLRMLVPYDTSEVGQICDGLNKQNRMSKLSSMECQRLFLSLYFSSNVEVAQAVVTGLRMNGLIVYVPKFDLKGPLYLSDIDGTVQMDPTLFGLAPDAGQSPTAGFVAAPGCRRLPSASSSLRDSQEGPTLEIVVPDSAKRCVFQPLDVVTVQLSCDMSDVRARIPPPRLHLVSKTKQQQGTCQKSEPRKVTSTMVCCRENVEPVVHNLSTIATRKEQSLYTKLSSIVIKPVLRDAPLRMHQTKTPSTVEESTRMPGRLCFGGFHNPDTHSATQEAAQAAASEAAAQRRAMAMSKQSRRDEYDTTRTIEREVTSRMQRLQAEKRSTRRSKAK